MITENKPAGTGVVPEIISTRIIEAPRERVFKAWSDPRELAQWWGPKGFTNTFHAFDFQPGGAWVFTMHSPDGTNYENKCVFSEIIGAERIEFQHLQPVHGFRAIATFDETGGKTTLTFSMLFESLNEYERVVDIVRESNEQNFDRLENLLFKKPN